MPGFSLSNLMANNRDYSRGYTFYLYVNSPAGIVGTEEMGYLTKSTSLPATTLDTATANWQGNVYKVGTTQTFSDWSVTVMCDPSDMIRKDFIEWVRIAHDPETNHHGTPNAYMRDQNIEHISHYDGSPIMRYKLLKAFPTSVGEISLDYGSKDLASFNVTFAYQYFQSA